LAILSLHKIHVLFSEMVGGFEYLLSLLAVQSLIQLEPSYFRNLLALAELHYWHIDSEHNKQSPLFGITCINLYLFLLFKLIK